MARKATGEMLETDRWMQAIVHAWAQSLGDLC